VTSPLLLLFPINALALLAVGVDVLFLEPYDGEFLAEGWPQNYVWAATSEAASDSCS
jgi:hypothetical protein